MKSVPQLQIPTAWSPVPVNPALSAPAGTSVPRTTINASAGEQESAGDQAYAAGKFQQAVDRFNQALQQRPGTAGLHFKLGCAAWANEQLDMAEQHLLAAIELDPTQPLAHDRLALLYIDMDRIELAMEQSEAARKLLPGNDDFALTHANALERSGNWQDACAILEPFLGKSPVSARVAGLFAQLARHLGRQEEAAALLDQLLRTAELSDAERSRLSFAVAKLLDSMGRYDQAFAHARTANQLANRPHDPDVTRARIERQTRYCTPGQLRALPHATHGSRRPVFIVGMPRSGTSLVEQILAAHPQIHGGGELPDVPRMVDAVSRRSSYPECLETYSLNTFNRLARQYLAGLDKLDADATYVTDKLPLNCLYLDLIQLLFPRCRVIHCVRDPLDTCLSCHMTGFASGNAFTSDLSDLGAFYRQYERLMKHWRAALDLPILDVQYEGLVADLEGQIRRILDFLELPWDERCLRFFDNKRPVATASRDQVTRPIYQSSVGRWKHYERHLGELIDALRSGG